MPLLSICVPTYNRVADLATLSQSFLCPVLDNYTEIEVVVCDNSEDEVALQNKAGIDSRIRYIPNGLNLGFEGNVNRCLENANGEFIWILSDNDPVHWTGFVEMVEHLRAGTADCYLIPYTYEDAFGVPLTQDYGFLRTDGLLSLRKVLENADFLPFVLLSSGVVRVNRRNIDSVRKNLSGNIFVQVALLLMMLSSESRIKILRNPVIAYQTERDGRFAPLDMFESILRLVEFLALRFDEVRKNQHERCRNAFKSMMFLLLNHRSGLYKVRDGDESSMGFARLWWNHADVKNTFLLGAVCAPRFLSAPVYRWFLAKRYADQKAGMGPYSWGKSVHQGLRALDNRTHRKLLEPTTQEPPSANRQ